MNRYVSFLSCSENSLPDGKARLRLTERVIAGCAALTMDELKLIAAQIDGVVKQRHKKMK